MPVFNPSHRRGMNGEKEMGVEAPPEGSGRRRRTGRARSLSESAAERSDQPSGDCVA